MGVAMRSGTIALVLAASLGGTACLAQESGRSEDRGRRPAVGFDELRAGFASPDLIYAPFAFWFWDAALDPEQTAAMAREMCRQGLNPGYAHPRRGLPRESWLAPEWFEAFGAALDQAEAAGAYLGYCDEYWWPSGQADGRVLEAHPELAAVSLDWSVRDVEGGGEVQLPESFFTVAARRAQPESAAPPPARPRLGQWIWHPEAQVDGGQAWFRRALHVERAPRIASASMAATADDQVMVFLNGEKLGDSEVWWQVSRFDLAGKLREGRNQIAVLARNAAGPCGLNLGLEIVYEDGAAETLVTDGSWRTSAEAGPGWRSAGYDDGSWDAPVVTGESSKSPPWNLPPGELHVPARIQSESLRILGSGPAFAWRAPEGRWRVYSFEKRFHAGVDGGKVNYIDRRLTPAFIEIAHEPYAEALGARMGGAAPGVFVDNEGDYGYKLAWSDDLEREYRERKGRDLRAWMPLLIDEDVEGRWAAARWDWHDVVSEIYADGYLGAVSRWLEARGMYCISNLWEETLFVQAYAVGDFFRAQRAVSLPGNDCLVEKALKVHDFKETQSVAEFEGRRFQSEILGVAGWQMSPVLMKRAVNAVIAWGVSHIVPHGINLERDLAAIPYPPDWFSENPYWRYLHLWTDFARRACYVNSHGRLAPDVLLINPMDSVWALIGGQRYHFQSALGFGYLLNPGELPGGENEQTINRIDTAYSRAIDELTAERIEYLIADRHYLQQMECTPDGRLVRGDFEFRAAILPPVVVLPLASAERLVAFAEAGGALYLLGELPRGSTESGLGCPRMEELVSRLEAAPSVRRAPDGLAPLVEAGAPGLAPQTRFESGEFPLIAQHRRIDGRELYWLVNDSGGARECALVFRDARGSASIWDCESGSIEEVPSRSTPSGSLVELVFEPYQAFWLVFDPELQPVAARAEEVWGPPAALDGPWNVRIDPSVQPPGVAPDLGAPQELLSPEGVERPLASWLDWKLERFSGFVDYRCTLDSPTAGGRLVLDLGEVRHMAEVWVNGEPVGARLWPPFEYEIGGAVVAGENRVLVRVGNLLCNAMSQHAEAGRMSWRPRAPTREERDAGLLGPVSIRRQR